MPRNIWESLSKDDVFTAKPRNNSFNDDIGIDKYRLSYDLAYGKSFGVNDQVLNREHKRFLFSQFSKLEQLDGGKTILGNLSRYLSDNKKRMIVNAHKNPKGGATSVKLQDGNIELDLNLSPDKVIQRNGEHYSKIPGIKSKTNVNGLDVVEVSEMESPFYLTLGHELNHMNHRIFYGQSEYKKRLNNQEMPVKEDGKRFPEIPHLSLRRDGVNTSFEERSNVFHHKAISDLSLTLQARARGENVPIRHIYQGANDRYYETVDNVLSAAGDYAPQVQKYIAQLPRQLVNDEPAMHWEYTPFAVGQQLGYSSGDFLKLLGDHSAGLQSFSERHKKSAVYKQADMQDNVVTSIAQDSILKDIRYKIEEKKAEQKSLGTSRMPPRLKIQRQQQISGELNTLEAQLANPQQTPGWRQHLRQAQQTVNDRRVFDSVYNKETQNMLATLKRRLNERLYGVPHGSGWSKQFGKSNESPF